jgi:glutamate--cysteine ligase
MVDYIAAGCKPASDWRLGTEHEKFGFLTDTLTPLPYAGPRSISALFDGLIQRYGWAPVHEGGNIIGLKRAGANISLEPGGQFELSGAPLSSVHDTAAETDSHMTEVKSIADPLGIGFLGIGAAPVWTHDQMPVMPKGRYRLMTDYMGRVGTHGTQMMYRTCTVQVNLDFASEADMVKKLRTAIALQPVATALFASSPFFEAKPNGHRSWRSRIWRGLDNARTGTLPFVFDGGMGFERWVDWVLDVPMYFVYRDGQYINALGQSFRDFLRGELPALPGEKPTLSDFADHMTTVFPEARVKQYIEMRGADAGSQPMMNALPAFWVGLMYDSTALDAAWDIVKGWDTATREGLRIAASEQALAGAAEGVSLADLSARVLALSEAGLRARGLGEEVFLAPLTEEIASGQTRADRLLALYNGDWNHDLTPIYDACRL